MIRSFKREGTKVLVYIRGRIYDVILFHTAEEAEAYIEKELIKQVQEILS
jgi:hypothetical protein